MTAIDILVKATGVLALAAVLDAALRRRGSAAARHLVWASAMTGLLALALGDAALPHWTVAIPVAAPTPIAYRVAAAVNDAVPAVSLSALSAQPALDWTTLTGLTGLIGLLVAAYVIGVVILIARLLLEPIALRRLARASRDLRDDGWLCAVNEAVGRFHITRRIRLLQSASDIVPITFGTLRPVVVVPASADEWSDDRRRAVLLHELAHVARWDCLTQLLGAAACAVYWPHPGVWLAARRLRLERELACDDRVLAAGAEPSAYAGHLLDLAHSLRPAPALATGLAMARARDLESRLLAIVDGARNRATLPRVQGAIAAAVSLA